MIENSWLFPVLEAVHVIGLAMLVGTIVLGDLATLGLVKEWTPRFEASRWTAAGLVVMLLTGVAMFLANTERYLANPAFAAKMGVLLVAAVLYRTRPWRWGAVASLVLWTLAVFASRAVIDFDV